MGLFKWLVKKKTNEEFFSEEKINIILCLEKARKFIKTASYEASYWNTPVGYARLLFGSRRGSRRGYRLYFPFNDSFHWLNKALSNTELLVQKIKENKTSGSAYRGGSLSNNQIYLLDKFSNLSSQIKDYYIPSLTKIKESSQLKEGPDEIKSKGPQYNFYREVQALIKNLEKDIKSIKAIR